MLLLGLGWGATAQTLSLDDCRQEALEHNLQLKNSRLDFEAARQLRREAFTKYFPQVSAEGMIFQAQEGLAQVDLEVSLPLPIPNLAPLNLPLSLGKRGLVTGVVAVQPVFAGLKIVNGNKLARLGEEVSLLKLEKTQKEITEQTDTYFWQVISLRENLLTLDAVDRQLEEIYRQAELSVKAGLVTRNDLLRVELRRQEIASMRLKVENGLHISLMLLAQHLGRDWHGFDVVNPGFASPADPQTYYVTTEEALDLRAEYQMAQKNVEAQKYQKRMERGKNLPTVGVGAGYMHYNITEKNINNGMVFAQVSLPISQWWGGSHAVRRARIREEQAANDLLHAEEMLKIEIEKTWSDLLLAYQQIEIANRSVASATENLRQLRNYYSVGTASLTELLDAESIYTRSKADHTSACAAYQTALAGYMRVTGR